MDLKKSTVSFFSLLGEIILFLAISFLVYCIYELICNLTSIPSSITSNYSVSGYIVQCLAFGVSIFILNRYVFKRSSYLTGIPGYRPIISFLISGGVALLILSICFLILFQLKYIDDVDMVWNSREFWYLALLFIFQSASEELMSRSFLLVAIESRFGSVMGILLSSMVFFILHAGNPNVTNFALFNIFIAGILFGVLLVWFRNFWLLLGFHAGWNFVQGVVYDFNVSGLDFFSTIRFDVNQDNIITGGAFGPEGSVIVSSLLVVCLMLIYWKYPQPPVHIKNQELT